MSAKPSTPHRLPLGKGSEDGPAHIRGGREQRLGSRSVAGHASS
ncbi:hypothetical protein ACCQ10_03270 [Xanthomonas sp. NCPPB 1325]